MNRTRRKKYWHLRSIRKERDYQIGKIQYANRPYTFPSVSPAGIKKKVMTTNIFMKENFYNTPTQKLW